MATPHNLLKKQWRRAREELILDIAEEVLTEKGYHNMSVDEVAAHAGVAKGTLYQHFPSKEALVFALFIRNVVLLEKTVAQVAGSTQTARAKLEHIFHYIYLERRVQHTQLLQSLRYAPEVRHILQEKQRQLLERMEQIADQIGTILEEGKAEGLFDPTISTALMQNIFMHMLGFSWRGQPGEELPSETFVTQIGHIFFEGIAVKKL